MGKKSKKKKLRRELESRMKGPREAIESDFRKTVETIFQLFKAHTPEDVFISLAVSDLWGPNISSQVRHILAFAIASGMNEEKFSKEHKITSHESFAEFITKLYDLLPELPNLEDYIPERDWGEIRHEITHPNPRIFYGGAVERISDFISAYWLTNSQDEEHLNDMRVVLKAQDFVIGMIPRDVTGLESDISPGHIEVPSKSFWEICGQAISQLSKEDWLTSRSARITTELGVHNTPMSWEGFANSIFDGTALILPFVSHAGRAYPLSLRNSASNIISAHESSNKQAPPNVLSNFLSRRIRGIASGPFRMATREKVTDPTITSVISSNSRVYMVIPVESTEIGTVSKALNQLADATNSPEWALLHLKSRGAMQLRTKQGVQPRPEDIEYIVVQTTLTTAPHFVKFPFANSTLLSLPDFVTIFDSITDADEFSRFMEFKAAQMPVIGGLSGICDIFAAFRDSSAVLADGAINPTMISLDPHWASGWRYRELSHYWNNVPPSLPSSPKTEWIPERYPDGLHKLESRSMLSLCWTATTNKCIAHFVMIADKNRITIDDARVLDLFVQCIADSLNQRRELVDGLDLLDRGTITTTFIPNNDYLVTSESNENPGGELFSNINLSIDQNDRSIEAFMEVNLRMVQSLTIKATDAAFEALALEHWLTTISNRIESKISEDVLSAIRATSARRPRFVMHLVRRAIDVPDHSTPNRPTPEHYKLARRDLAIAFREVGALEGKYECEQAKPLIDSARDLFRENLHKYISRFSVGEISRMCIEELEATTSAFDRSHSRIKISLEHEVNYNRSKTLADANEEFLRDSRNLRYLLECRLSCEHGGSEFPNTGILQELIASIDWLMVLYNASDVLHNGLDVAGLELDHLYIPHVFYSQLSRGEDSSFSMEAADFKLGIGVDASDEVGPIEIDHAAWTNLEAAFKKDVGVNFRNFVTSLRVLSQWASAIESNDLRLSYSATKERICEVLRDVIEGLSQSEAAAIVSLATLEPSRIRRLVGRDTQESDVPVWEHLKRGDRLTIKPIISISDGTLMWGAASAERAARIWMQTLSNGYLPADYDWMNVKKAVRSIKSHLDIKLEDASTKILRRSTRFSEGGIDFMRRFPNEGFPDVGDFDGLAFWPELNTWVSVECKYNQPAFCLKDARRLRERIFGSGDDKGQFSKIEGRRAFLLENSEKLRCLLKWPSPNKGLPFIYHELYVSRDIYFWMRATPYTVPTCFVRVDALGTWLRDHGLTESAG